MTPIRKVIQIAIGIIGLVFALPFLFFLIAVNAFGIGHIVGAALFLLAIAFIFVKVLPKLE